MDEKDIGFCPRCGRELVRGVKFILSADAHAADAIDCTFDRFGDCEAFVSSPVKK